MRLLNASSNPFSPVPSVVSMLCDDISPSATPHDHTLSKTDTETFTFTAQPAQEGHNWIFLYTTDAPGMVLSNCIPANQLHVDNSLLKGDTTICDGTSITLAMPEGDYSYRWSTGDNTQTITVSDSGYYWGTTTAAPMTASKFD